VAFCVKHEQGHFLETPIRKGALLKSLFMTAVMLASVSATAMAQPAQPQRSGTPEEQKACAKDVSRFCRTMMNEGDLVILSCLQQHRPSISAACNRVLTNHGQ
jgi:hypothetical protein